MQIKGFFILFFLLIFIAGSFANNPDIRTQQLLEVISNPKFNSARLSSSPVLAHSMRERFHIFQTPENEWCASVFLQIDPANFDQQSLLRENIQFQQQTDNILTAIVPLSALSNLQETNGINRLELARQVHLRLDVSSPEIAADRVHQGISEVSQAFTGKGVIVGIIDSGLDITHPDFLKTDGSTRVLYIWDQNESNGSQPAGYSYGIEWTASQINGGQCTHIDYEPHGTHVAGIAAGDGSANSGKYKGIAPDADLIIVSTRGLDTDVADGIKYIFGKASSLGKPAVINLSLGSHQGPHDGTSSFDQILAGQVGSGKIAIGALGNEGTQYVHLSGQISNDSLFSCFANASDGVSDYNYLEVWGKTGSDITLAVLAVDLSQNVKYHLASNKRNISKKYFMANNDTIATFWIGYETNSNNNNQHYQVTYELNSNANVYDWYLRLGGSGEFDVWTEGNPSGVNFKPNQPTSFPYNSSRYKGGDNESSMGEIGGTSSSIISIGAYTTKTQWTNYANDTYRMNPEPQVDDIAPFSSFGPTRDGRMKPELCAPGNIITSALSVNADVDMFGDARIVYAPAYPNLMNAYLNYEGTSMAAPHVTGTVALMLEAKPGLTPNDVKVLLTRNTRKDDYTTSSANNTWGYGKVDAYYSVKNAATFTGVESFKETKVIKSFKLFDNYPNPFNAQTEISFELPTRGEISIQIFDLLGKRVANVISGEFPAGFHQLNYNAEHLSSGIYFYQLTFNNQSKQIKKMVLVK